MCRIHAYTHVCVPPPGAGCGGSKPDEEDRVDRFRDFYRIFPSGFALRATSEITAGEQRDRQAQREREGERVAERVTERESIEKY